MKRNFSEKTLIVRLRVLLILSVGIVSIFFTIQAYFSNVENYRRAVSNKLEAVTKSLSFQISGEDHLKLTLKYLEKDAIITNGQNPTYLKIHELLKNIQKANNIKSTIYTMVIDSSILGVDRPLFRFGVSSSDKPFYFHPFSTYPDEELKKFEVGAVLAPYEDENGTWISSFSPIKTGNGRVVAIVQADIEFDEYISAARNEALKQLIIIPPFLLLVFLIASRILKRIVTREDMVTQLKESLNNADIAKVKAEDALKSQEIFLAKVSHEMRTPLNGIIGITNLIDKNKLSSSEQDDLDLVVDSGKGLLMIINDLLDASKIESGDLKLELVPFNLTKSLSSVAHLLKTKIGEKGIDFKISLGACEGNFIGDDLRLKQVVTNLLSNAVKFTPSNGTIELYVEKVSSNVKDCRVKIGVKDSGIGIAKEKQAHIFEEFKQENDDTTREYGGTGLGLSISKRLVELFGGELKLESEKGKGAHFFFEITFPRTDAEPVSVLENEAIEINLSGIDVLIADDNIVNRKIAQNVIQQKGGKTVLVENGIEAVEAVKSKKFDLILMDLQMPLMAGDEATRVIKNELSFEGAVIALTANAITGEKEKYLAMGMDDYLTKPFIPSDLYSRISNLLNIEVSKPLIEEKELKSTSKLYDLATLDLLSGSDEAFKKDILQTFVNQSGEALQVLQTYFKAGEFELLARAAHKFNSSVDSIGIVNGKEILKSLEIECKKTDRDLEFIHQQIETIINITGKVKKDIIKNYLG